MSGVELFFKDMFSNNTESILIGGKEKPGGGYYDEFRRDVDGKRITKAYICTSNLGQYTKGLHFYYEDNTIIENPINIPCNN